MAHKIRRIDLDLCRGLRMFQSGDLAAAESACRRAVRRDPADASALRLLGILAGRRGDAPDSLRFLEAAVRLRPNDPDALNDLGVTRERLGDFAAAADCYRKSLQAGPNSCGVWTNLANA